MTTTREGRDLQDIAVPEWSRARTPQHHPGTLRSENSPPSRPEKAKPEKQSNLVRELGVVLALTLLFSVLIKTFLAQAYFIPSESMEPTLYPGDRVIVSKLTPQVLPLKHGDVVVFRDPNNWLPPAEHEGTPLEHALSFVGLGTPPGEQYLIKRVIGLPGDKVRCCSPQGLLSVNGVPQEEPYLPPGVRASTIPFDITVPPGHVWVMGDNREHSSDSRFNPSVEGRAESGAVPLEKLVGRAVVVPWPLSHASLLRHEQAHPLGTSPNATTPPLPTR